MAILTREAVAAAAGGGALFGGGTLATGATVATAVATGGVSAAVIALCIVTYKLLESPSVETTITVDTKEGKVDLSAKKQGEKVEIKSDNGFRLEFPSNILGNQAAAAELQKTIQAFAMVVAATIATNNISHEMITNNQGSHINVTYKSETSSKNKTDLSAQIDRLNGGTKSPSDA